MDLLPIEDPSCFTACYKSSEVSIHPIAINLNKKGIKRKLDVSSPMHSKLSHGYSNDAVSYIIETPEQRGKFLVEKAIALEVPKGKLFGQLHQGKDVILPNGRLVKSSDCVSPSVPGGGAGIIVCPSTEYIESLLESKGFLRYQTQANDPQPPAFQLQVLYHFGDSKVLTHPGYVEFIKRFGPSVQHVLVGIIHTYVECIVCFVDDNVFDRVT
jgi:ribonuclease Z